MAVEAAVTFYNEKGEVETVNPSMFEVKLYIVSGENMTEVKFKEVCLDPALN